MFGITYKPYGKQKKQYNQPSGPAFEDEAEFERELLQSRQGDKSSNNNTTVDDDEFDLDDESIIAAAENLKKFVASSITAQNDGDLTDQHEVTPSNDTDKTTTPTVVDEDADKKLDILNMAKNAFKEITEVYSSGLGDHEISVIQEKPADKTFANLQNGGLFMGVAGAMEEVDEDEIMRQEEEENAATVAAVNAEKRVIDELESIWENVNANGSPSGKESTKSSQKMSYDKLLSYLK
jgi:hypothetical protein